jgi:hypothetical protein
MSYQRGKTPRRPEKGSNSKNIMGFADEEWKKALVQRKVNVRWFEYGDEAIDEIRIVGEDRGEN